MCAQKVIVAEQGRGKNLFTVVSLAPKRPGGPLAQCLRLKAGRTSPIPTLFYWGDKLLALWEAAEPHRLDPKTLSTIGLDYLDGLISTGVGPSPAHPKFDPGHHGGQPRLVGFSLKAGLSSTIYPV